MLCMLSVNVFAQNVGIGTLTPDASAQLEINSTTKGLLIPRTTTASIVSPVTGLLIFDTGTNSFQFFNGASWVQISTGGATNYWTQTGNNLTNNNTGNVGINFSSPGERLHVDGNLKLGSSAWSSSANDRFLKIGDGSFVTIGETGQDDRMTLAARNFIFTPSSNYPGYIGINVTNPLAPLSFANVVGQKINFWNTDATHNYGIGVQGGLLQLHTNDVSADVVFGYGSSNVFNETMRIKGTGNVGIGTNNPQATLDVNGTLRLSGGSPVAGKVLTTDNTGNAAWSYPVAYNTACDIYTSGFSASSNATSLVSFDSENYDDGNNFNNTPGNYYYAAPVAGVYHFDISIFWTLTSVVPKYEIDLDLGTNPNNLKVAFQIPASTTGFYSTVFSTSLKLSAGEQVQLKVYQNSGISQATSGAYNSFKAYRVY